MEPSYSEYHHNFSDGGFPPVKFTGGPLQTIRKPSEIKPKEPRLDRKGNFYVKFTGKALKGPYKGW